MLKSGLAAVVAMALSAAPAMAVLTPGLYGVSDGNPGAVYSIDTATGQATLVTALELATNAPGAEFYKGTLFASNVRVQVGDHQTGSINPDTGAFTPLWDQGFLNNVHGLAANEADEVFYFSFSDDTPGFGTLDANTGQATFPSLTPNRFLYALAYDRDSGLLYGTDGASLFTVDKTTGNSTEVGAFATTVGFQPGLAFDPITDTLYLNTGSDGNLYTVDTATGAATLIGSNGLRGVEIEGLAFLAPAAEPGAVPEPVTAVSVGGALMLAGLRVTRRARKV